MGHRRIAAHRLILLSVLLFSTAFVVQPSAAAQIDVIQKNGARPAIMVLGELVKGDERKFVDAALPFDDAIVVMSSPGGNLWAGIEIGKAIRLKRFETLIMGNYQCASACALAWLGGVTPTMDSTALVGFHAASLDGKEMGAPNAIVGAYLSHLNYSQDAIVFLTSEPPDGMQWLTPGQARELGAKVLEPKKIANSNPYPSPQLAPDDEVIPDNSKGVSPRYVVDGLALYGKVAFGSKAYLRYSCESSRFFPTYTWCNRIGKKNGPGGTVGTVNSILHNMDGDAYYIYRSAHPVFFAPGEAQEYIESLNAKYGQKAEIVRMPKTEGYANGFIARWGSLTLAPLSDPERRALEKGNNITGTFLIDFLRDDWKKSIRLGLPIYKIGGGAGFLWSVSTSSYGVAQVNVRAADLNAARGFQPQQNVQVRNSPNDAFGELFSDEENDEPDN